MAKWRKSAAAAAMAAKWRGGGGAKRGIGENGVISNGISNGMAAPAWRNGVMAMSVMKAAWQLAWHGNNNRRSMASAA